MAGCGQSHAKKKALSESHKQDQFSHKVNTMNEAAIALTIDLSVVTGCAFFLFKLGRLSAMHPALIYLFFHVWVVTKRMTELALGAPLSAAFPHQPITIVELTRASLMFDVVLVVMTIAWIMTSVLDLKRNGPLPAPGQEKAPNLSKAYFVRTAQIMVPLGIYGLLKGGGTGDWDKSFATTTLVTFLPISMMLFFYWYGPRPWLIAAILATDFLCETRAGDTRWLLLLPTIFFCFAYLSRVGRSWPPRKVVLVLIVAGIFWLPGKQISHTIAAGGGLADISRAVTTTWVTSATQADHPDNQFLDMAAMTVGLVDEKRKFFYGSTMYTVFYNFIPRPLWPDKPPSAEWEIEVSTVDRPMHTYGMTASLMGAAYVDFGYTGIVIIPFLFALYLGWAYFQAFRCTYYSVGRYWYLVMACTLFEPYRDGFSTFILFNCIALWPLGFVALLHLFYPMRTGQQQPRYPKFVRITPAERSAQLNGNRIIR